MKEINYQTQGTCARIIHIEIDDNNIIKEVIFMGGCMGNTQGVAALAKGQSVENVIAKLRGIQCGNKGTSCPDQLSKALEQALL